jgi:outer membrane lipoprotein-sorting protein
MRCLSLICIALLMASGSAAEERFAAGVSHAAEQSPAVHEMSDAAEIVRRADRHVRGESSRAELSMEIVRPDWSRRMSLKFWSKGNDRALILITAPARDRGTTFLLRNDEVWNYRPDIDRVIKLPPSMMSQSWMGTDFTNDDLVRESSIVEDYHHEIVGDTILAVGTASAENAPPADDLTATAETTRSGGTTSAGDTPSAADSLPAEDSTSAGRRAWEIKLTTKPEAAVVWGQIRLWIGQEHYLQLHAEYYDEDGELVNVMEMSRIREMGGRLLPTNMVMRPVEEEGHRTRMTYDDIEFNIEIDDDFFSQQNMKRIRP